MAALAARRAGAAVVLLEPNEKLGRKLYITGKGRCNLTNNTTPEGVLAHVTSKRALSVQRGDPVSAGGRDGIF
ncbi:MAG: hypothetical protein ACLR1T_02170 [Evtepia gabavorous]